MLCLNSQLLHTKKYVGENDESIISVAPYKGMTDEIRAGKFYK